MSMTDEDLLKTSKDDTTDESSASHRSRGRLQSQKLDRTLKELESAFSEWDKLPAQRPSEPGNLTVSTKDDDELKKKTRKLLVELREQLESL